MTLRTAHADSMVIPRSGRSYAAGERRAVVGRDDDLHNAAPRAGRGLDQKLWPACQPSTTRWRLEG